MTLSQFLMDQILGILPSVNQTIHELNGKCFHTTKVKNIKMLSVLIELIGSSINNILPQVIDTDSLTYRYSPCYYQRFNCPH